VESDHKDSASDLHLDSTYNMDAQQQSLMCIKAPKCLGKFISYMTFGAHKLVRSQLFLDSRCERCDNN